jgi:FAD-linked sulfhydryl oxidase
MTKYWGPLGWTTLHTVSALYPDRPTSAEIELAKNWIQQFADCITCPSCQGHFKTMLGVYQSRNPNMFASRREFSLFVIRAHNTVNRRLGKKIYTYDDVWNTVAQWDDSKAKSKRYEYLTYLRRDWGSQTTLAGITALGRVRDLTMAEQQYWSQRTLDWNKVRSVITSADDLLTPILETSKPSVGASLFEHPMSQFSRVPNAIRTFRVKQVPVGSLSLISR